MNDETKQLVEAYYLVARDIQARAEGMLSTADLLGKIADKLCEESIRVQAQQVPQPADRK